MSGPTKLFLPDPEIRLYKEGFGQDDILDRAKTGTQMSDLLQRISDPLVIALDGKWGTGKTHFLKRWVGAHETNSDYQATTLYFDAFESDFLDDPLIALTAALDNRINTAETSSAFKKMKLHASKLAGPLVRIGLSIATYGMTEVANATVDAALTQAEKEGQKALDDFWAREIGKRAAMRGFRDGLKDLTAPTENSAPNPLIIVIDELDRCRPDYALALIETIKHFFAVPHVHFVLGVNLDALQHSVRVRYGAAFDAEEYLRRFIHLRLTLPEKFDKGWGKVDAWELILDRALADMGFKRAFADHLTANITLRCRHEVISIRDLSRVLTRAALLPRKARADGLRQGWREVIITLLLMDVLDRKCFEMLTSGRGAVSEVDKFYGLTQTTPPVVDGRQQSPNAGLQVSAIWQFITTNGDAPTDIVGKITPMFDPYRNVPDPQNIIWQVFDDYFSNISMFEANQSG